MATFLHWNTKTLFSFTICQHINKALKNLQPWKEFCKRCFQQHKTPFVCTWKANTKGYIFQNAHVHVQRVLNGTWKEKKNHFDDTQYDLKHSNVIQTPLGETIYCHSSVCLIPVSPWLLLHLESYFRIILNKHINTRDMTHTEAFHCWRLHGFFHCWSKTFTLTPLHSTNWWCKHKRRHLKGKKTI